MSAPTDAALERLEAALTEAQAEVRAERPLHRYHARALLVQLGEWILSLEEREREPDSSWRERCSFLKEAAAESWTRAVEEELALASAEHIQAIDPRFLEHPRYDFAYTLAARERLEARLRACEYLEIEVAEGLLTRVSEADERLAPYLERRS